MICENKEKYSMFYSFIGCITNIIFNVLLIPKYGIIGAAIATLVSQISSNIISFSSLSFKTLLLEILVAQLLIASLFPESSFSLFGISF